MSAHDQPMLIANINYHIGHTIAIRVAEEQGYLREEGIKEHVFDSRGLIPAALERDGLALVMEEHGVDIGFGALVGAALHQRTLGADVYIVGGWRHDGPGGTRWYARKPVADLRALKGARIGSRERGGMEQSFLTEMLHGVGLDGEKDINWVFEQFFYNDGPRIFAALESGMVDVIPAHPPIYEEARRRNLSLVLDTTTKFPEGRPGKVIVATGKALRDRAAEVKAFLRATIRAFWFSRTRENLPYLQDLERRLRVHSHNEFEHGTTLLSGAEFVEGWPMPLNCAVPRDQLGAKIAYLVAIGDLPRSIAVDDVLKDELVNDAFRELMARPALQPAWAAVQRAKEKFGY